MCQGRIISHFCPSALAGDPRCPAYRLTTLNGGRIPAWSYYFDSATAHCCGRHSPRVDCGDCPYNTYGRRSDVTRLGQEVVSVCVIQGESICPVCSRRFERERREAGEETEGWAVREMWRGKERRERERLERMEREERIEEGRLVGEMERLRVEDRFGSVENVEVLRREFEGMRFC
ncbi:hypothetical protein NEUTE1DRAFT_58942 [Neurospora tetrasperma FGSC 2508]|uniref:Uncharacterized protein n=1 Tax=Neurospora tetrasperma (strain FGSC 2508 / ATCC MYA-4615 / P0657) TaxID=510951 RepID=F8ME06_NEUT8|nr:uncharacterized protein NEUTE1DRAFT_58942 [Neurospora tetrasperma FGSC 2508]EGO61541.1 hypothetical protein NEUTE1DRAFT_58942 [Neurospora tetrasperma FGSC 2508]EGZ74422.1 hypothetical protein NEUTE2DRAFT_103159 [Neurospora tetrasperma FGSC 2509]